MAVSCTSQGKKPQDQVFGILEQIESRVLWMESARCLLLPADFSMLWNIAVVGFKEIHIILLALMEFMNGREIMNPGDSGMGNWDV